MSLFFCAAKFTTKHLGLSDDSYDTRLISSAVKDDHNHALSYVIDQLIVS